MHLGAVPLFDWDEVNFAASAREMLITGDWERVTVNFEPFREKPPLFIWLQALSMYLWGIGTWAARFPNAIAGMITLWVLYWQAPRLYQKPLSESQTEPAPHDTATDEAQKATDTLHHWGWPLMLMSGTLPFMYFRSGIIDPWFNLFMLLSILAMSQTEGTARGAGLKSGAWAGLAVLTKGPVGLLIPGLVAAWMLLRNPNLRRRGLSALPFFLCTSLLVASLWFLPETLKNGLWFLRSFLVYQWELLRQPVAGHEQPWFYHFVVVFLGCFPFSIWAIPGVFRWRNKSISHPANHMGFIKSIKKALLRRRQSDSDSPSHGKLEEQPSSADATFHTGLESWMQATLWVVLVLFSLVSTKIIHYSSMAWVPLSALAWVGFQKSYLYKSRLKPGFWTPGQNNCFGQQKKQAHVCVNQKRPPVWHILPLAAMGMLVGLVWLFIAFIGRHSKQSSAYVREGSFEWGMLFQSQVNWPMYTYFPGILWITVCLVVSVLLARRKFTHSLLSMAVGIPATLWLIQIMLLPRVEHMVQGPLRQWCAEYADQNQTVVAWGYRSYAPFWYNRWTPDRRRVGENTKDSQNTPIYYVLRIDRLSDPEVQKRFETAEQRGGFSLMRLREGNAPQNAVP